MFSTFKTNYDTSPEPMTLKQAYDIIISDKYAEDTHNIRDLAFQMKCYPESTHPELHRQIKKSIDVIKAHIQAATFAGQFYRRGKEECYESTGIMTFDYDEVKCVEKNKELKARIDEIKCVSLSFFSPSGGLKFLVHTDLYTTDNNRYRWYYERIQKLFEKKLGITLDSSTKDISRLTNFSHDTNASFKEPVALVVSDKLSSAYDEHMLKIQEEQRKALEEIERSRDREICTQTQTERVNYFVNQYRNNNSSGNRHTLSFKLCINLFKCALHEFEVKSQCTLLQFEGCFTDDIDNQVQSAKRAWTRKPEYYNVFKKRTKQTLWTNFK